MMEKAEEKREFSIDNKIFTKDDILLLIKLFGKLSNEILDKSKEIRHKDLIQEGWKESNIKERDIDTSYSNLVFISYDNSTFGGTLEDILEDNEILENKNIAEINFCFFERTLNSHLIIRVKHTDSVSHSSSSYVSVEGQDRTWVNGTINLLDDFISNCKSQSEFVKKFQIPIMVITIFMMVFFMFNLTELFIKTNLSFPKMIDNMFRNHLISFVIVSFLIAAAPAFFIKERLKRLFPGIEIQTGKTLHQIKKEKSKKLLIITSIILIPAIFSFLLHLIIH
jgi:hypothetical protein